MDTLLGRNISGEVKREFRGTSVENLVCLTATYTTEEGRFGASIHSVKDILSCNQFAND